MIRQGHRLHVHDADVAGVEDLRVEHPQAEHRVEEREPGEDDPAVRVEPLDRLRHPATPRASRAASTIAAIRLDGSATPRPAMSKAVP